MFCQKCGTKLNVNDKFCCKCGTKVQKLATNNSSHLHPKDEKPNYKGIAESSKSTAEQLHNNLNPSNNTLRYFLACSLVYPYLYLMDVTHFFGFQRYFERRYSRMYGYGTYNYFDHTGIASEYYVIMFYMIPMIYETYIIIKYMERFCITGIKPKVITFMIIFLGSLMFNGLPLALAPLSIFVLSFALNNKSAK